MTEVLLGSASEPGGSSSAAMAAGKEYASAIKCVKSGELTELELWSGSTVGQEGQTFGIFNCNQTTGVPEGEPLGEGYLGEKPSGKKVKVKIKLNAGVSVTVGTYYAIGALTKGANGSWYYTNSVGLKTWKATNVGLTKLAKGTTWEEFAAAELGVCGVGVGVGAIALNPAASTSNGSLGVTAKQPMELAGAVCASAASLQVEVKPQVPLNAAVCHSAASNEVTSGVARLGLAAAVCSSTAAMTVVVKPQLPLAAAVCVSGGELALTTGHAAELPLAAAASHSTGSLSVLGGLALLAGEPADTIGAQRSIASGKPVAYRALVDAGGAIVQAKFWTGNTVGTGTSYIVGILEDHEYEAGRFKPGAVLATVKGSEAQAKNAQRLAAEEATGEIPAGAKYVWLAILPIGGTILAMFAEESGGVQPWKCPSVISSFSEATWEQSGAGSGVGTMDVAVYGAPRPGILLEGAASTSTATAGVTAPTQINLAPAASISNAGLAAGNAAAILPAVAASSTAAAVTVTTSVSLPLAAASCRSLATALVKASISYGENEQQITEMYPGAAPGQPIVIFVAGGGWVFDQTQQIGEDVLAFWKASGFNVYNADYRHASATNGAWPAALEDLEAVVALAQAGASRYNGDASRVYLVGGSAGGNLVPLVAERLNASFPGTIRGVCCLSGIYNVQLMVEEMESGAYREHPGGGAEKHGGGSVNNLTEHTEMALQQNMHYVAPYEGEGEANVPPLTGKPLTNLEASRLVQREWSPALRSQPAGCRYLLFSAPEDLIPNNQWEAMKAKLESESRAVQVKLTEGAHTKQHAFEYWGAKIGGHLLSTIIELWIGEPEPAIVPTAPAASSSTAGLEVDVVPMLPLAPAAAHSSASLTVVETLGLSPAVSTSTASLVSTTQAVLQLEKVGWLSTATVSVSTLGPVSPAAAVCSSTASLEVTAFGEGFAVGGLAAEAATGVGGNVQSVFAVGGST